MEKKCVHIEPPTELPNVVAPPPPSGRIQGITHEYVVRDEYGTVIEGVSVKSIDRYIRVYYFVAESPLHLEAWLTKMYVDEHLMLVNTSGDRYFIFRDLTVENPVIVTTTGKGKIYNLALEYAATWIENSLIGEENTRVIEFGRNMAMSIRAGKEGKHDTEK